MNVLIVSQYFWPESFRINDLALGLRDRGHSVTVLTGIPNYPTGSYFDGYTGFNKLEEAYEGVRVLRAPLVPRGNGSSIRLAVNYLSFVLSASIASLMHRVRKQDVIFVFEPSPITVGIPAILNKHLHKAPLFFWVQDLWPESIEAVGAISSKPVMKAVERLVRFIYKRCDVILVQSQAFIDSIRKHCDSQQSDIKYFPNSTECYYAPAKVDDDSPESELVPRGFVVMFAGNIGVAQDFPTILAAAERTREFPDIKWVIIGDGRQRNWVVEEVRIRRLEDTVHFIGRYPAEQMPRFFAMADALLVTLKRDPIFALTIPSKVQSYLASARPIIAALDGEGARVIREAEAGLTCPAESPQSLAESVVALYRMPPEERERMGSNGRLFFEQHFEREMLLDRLQGWMTSIKNKETPQT